MPPRTTINLPDVVNCPLCGHIFGPDAMDDPVYAVACPNCQAKPRQHCIRPSGHSGPFVGFHKERDIAAAWAGAYDHIDPHTGILCLQGINAWDSRLETLAAKFKVTNLPERGGMSTTPQLPFKQPAPPPTKEGQLSWL